MKQKISGPLGIAAIIGAIALVGILGYSMIGSQAGSASDLEEAAQQQAARNGGGGAGAERMNTTSSAENRRAK